MTHKKVKTCWKIGYLHKEQLWKIRRKGRATHSHPLSCAKQSWVDRRHGHWEPTHPQHARGNRYPVSAHPSSKNPLKLCSLPRKSKEGPTRLTTVNHITPQGTARKREHENCREVHFKVGKRLGMIEMIKKESWMRRAKRENYLIFFLLQPVSVSCVKRDSSNAICNVRHELWTFSKTK